MATEVLAPQAHVFAEPHASGDSHVQRRRHTVATSMNYWDDPGDGSAPLPIVVGRGTITNKRPTVRQDVVVTDVSGEEDKYTLSSHGFQYLVGRPSLEKDFVDDAKIDAEYKPECEQLIKDITGARRVFIFDHKVRRGPTHWHGLGQNNLANRGPVTRVHVDQSYDGAELVLRRWLPDEADELVKRRYQIINVWRPIKTILKDPIAVADARSIPEADLVAAKSLYSSINHTGETWTLRPSAAHRWYFKHKQTPDDVLLIKCFDSDTSVARRTPHSAFEDPATVGEEFRQSVEVRCLVFH
ncbi:methyltransferase-like protein [Bombardia bombarda]|uniref:Methyltransferase-like protein n=1 Tax=Bombardia bombarda TaxID=252184 RepID=A0AA40BY06_9PEZI|nr:methyltransferase-like protein [Bombardia bombarda]